MAAGSSPHAAAATETRIISPISRRPTFIREFSTGSSLRLHGRVFVSRERRTIRGFTTKDRLVDTKFDHRVEVADPSAVFLSRDACLDLIHAALADAPVTGGYDLAAGNWDDFLRLDALAARIVDDARDALGGVADDPVGLVFHVRMTLWIRLVYSEPKALLLACKEADAAVAGSQRHRESGELCAICLLGTKSEGEETVGLPCSHVFHIPCIAPWFHRVSTCPTCRRDVTELLPGFAKTGVAAVGQVAEDES